MTSEALLIDRRNEVRWYPMRVTYGQTKAVRKALTERLLAEQDKTKVQKTMVRESLIRALDELH